MIVENSIPEVEKREIVDVFGRTFKTLRVSLTNTCNLACSYCVDPDSQKNNVKIDSRQALSTKDYIRTIESLHKVLDLDTIRLTGGEPLLYKEITPLIKGISSLGIKNIKMTSNATLLGSKAKELFDAGLRSINISLDSVDQETSHEINKRVKLTKILEGIDAAIDAGIQVKINTVIIKGVNDHQIVQLINYCKEKKISIRFLELMQMGHLYHNFEKLYFSEDEILQTIAKEIEFTPLKRTANATANYWITNDGYKFGIISNISNPFCNDCNRLRLDSYGNIFGCLSNNNPIKVIDSIDEEEKIREKLVQAIGQKKNKFSGSNLSMLHIGG